MTLNRISSLQYKWSSELTLPENTHKVKPFTSQMVVTTVADLHTHSNVLHSNVISDTFKKSHTMSVPYCKLFTFCLWASVSAMIKKHKKKMTWLNFFYG